MSQLNVLPCFLLSLSSKKRLGLAAASVIIFMLIFLLIPAPARNPAILCVPLALNAWLFRTRGWLISAVGMLLVQWTFYELSAGSAFLSLPGVFSFLIEALAFVCVGLLVSALRLLLERADTDRQQVTAAYEKLQQTQQVKDQFVANVTHELRTALTSVSGFWMRARARSF